MNKILLILFLTSFSALAEDVSLVTTGEAIKANTFNQVIEKVNNLVENSSPQGSTTKSINLATPQIGEVKTSILNQTQFQSLYGNCWRLMDGSSLTGTDLGTMTGMANLPNALTQGTSLKQVANGRVLGSYETDAVKEHTHGVWDPGHRHIEGTNAVNGNLRYGHTNASTSNRRSESGSGTTFASFTETVVTGIQIVNFGSPENTVRNTGVNFFIKVNNACN